MSVIITSRSLLPVRRDGQAVTVTNVSGGGGFVGSGAGGQTPALISIIQGTPVAGQVAVFHDAQSIEGNAGLTFISDILSSIIVQTGNLYGVTDSGDNTIEIGTVNEPFTLKKISDSFGYNYFTITGADGYSGDNDGSDLALKGGAPSGSGLMGNVRIEGSNVMITSNPSYGVYFYTNKIYLAAGSGGNIAIQGFAVNPNANADQIQIQGIAATGTAGNWNGGDLILLGGTKYGSGVDGSVYIGGTTNAVKIAPDGEMTFEGTATVWDDLRILPSTFDFAGGSDPAIVNYQPGGSGTTFKVWEFQLDDQAYFTCQLPHSYKTGTDIYCHVHWTPGTRGNEENGNAVAWKLDYSWANINDNFGASATIDMTDACDGTDHKHQMSPEVLMDGHTSAKHISSMLICRIYRHDVAGDTWSGTASGQLPILLEVDFHFEMDSIGSKTSSSK